MIRYIAVLTIICAFSSGLLSYINKITEAPIRSSLKKEQIKAIKEVLNYKTNDLILPKDPDKEGISISIKDSETQKPKKIKFYEAYGKKGKLQAVAIKTASFSGYSGFISIMIGIDINGNIKGTYVLEHSETPGLGSKIKSDDFKKQFINKSSDKNEPLKIEKFGGNIESISGASISSHAFTSAVNEAVIEFNKKYKSKEKK